MTDPSGGYFQSIVRQPAAVAPVSCNDPFGHQQFVTALLFARDRWGIRANTTMRRRRRCCWT